MTQCINGQNVSQRLDVAAHATIVLTGATKLWVVPDGYKWDCHLMCSDCFYIATTVTPPPGDGAVVANIGYGLNTEPKTHDGVAGVSLELVRDDTKKKDSVECIADKSCDVQKIIAGFNVTFNIL